MAQTGEKITLSIKDAIYVLLIVASVVSGHFTVEAKTSENSIRIDQLSKDITLNRVTNDKIGDELNEVKSLLMEIRGYLKQNDNDK